MSIARHESSITTLTWIPSETIEGLSRIPFELGITHYDEPPPDYIEDVEELRRNDRFREANELRAYIDVEDDGIVGYGYLGGGRIGSTLVRVGPARIRFPGVHLPDIQHEPEVGPKSVRFVQTIGGRMAIPTPRPVRRKPYAQFWPSIAWTTLELTINVDGSTSSALIGASPFPRHYVYDATGRLIQKSGVIDFKTWFSDSFGAHTPWGAVDSPAIIAAVESAMERELSTEIMHAGPKPRIRTLATGDALVTQGEVGTEVYMILDGMFLVEVDGEVVAEIGPGAIVGERAALEQGLRTATLRASTRARVAEAPPGLLDRGDLGAVAQTHHREEVPA
ncbi:MAG TPA: cyclic nucleotide-binding domain-containing protein [Patescibacteria group bacterium]|jgi:hypothetical protein|nr:cyclic nucleotide-binding domain-containing protein [Patescibacteria group bacterium]